MHRPTFPAPCKAYEPGLPTVELPRDVAVAAAVGDRGARRAGPGPPRLDLGARAHPVPLGRRRPDQRARRRPPLPLPRRRLRGRALPARGLRAAATRRLRRRALVRPDQPRPAAGRSAAGRRRDHADRHRHPVAHRLAVRRARLPPPLLGRRHDARPDARAGGPSRGSTRASRTSRSRASSAPTASTSSRSRSSRSSEAPAIEPTGDAEHRRRRLRPPLEFPLITHAQRAGDQRRRSAIRGRRRAPLDTRSAAVARTSTTVILERGSTRRMDPHATVAREHLRVLPGRRAARHRRPALRRRPRRRRTRRPGLYRDRDLDAARGNLRDELLWVTWDQDLGRDAAYVVMGATDLDALNDRGYREAQLQAGIVEGRLHVAAYALGIGASGMTFLDSEIEALLGEPLAGAAVHLRRRAGVPQQGRRPARRAGEGRHADRRTHAKPPGSSGARRDR